MTDTKMNPVVKELWLKALRSGEYKQARQVLHKVKTNGYCCLGVLCDVAIKAGVELSTGRTATDVDGANGWATTVTVTSYDDCVTLLPQRVQEWAGIPGGQCSAQLVELMEANDTGKRFTTIANIIEEKL